MLSTSAVSPPGRTLSGVMKVVSARVEVNWHSTEEAGGQRGRVSPPLLRCVTSIECVVELSANCRNPRFLKVAWRPSQLHGLLCNKRSRLLRGKVSAEKAPERV